MNKDLIMELASTGNSIELKKVIKSEMNQLFLNVLIGYFLKTAYKGNPVEGFEYFASTLRNSLKNIIESQEFSDNAKKEIAEKTLFTTVDEYLSEFKYHVVIK